MMRLDEDRWLNRVRATATLCWWVACGFAWLCATIWSLSFLFFVLGGQR